MSTSRAGRGTIAIGSFVGMTVTNSPILFIPFGLFLQPVSARFGWGRSVMPGALLVAAAAMTVLYPCVGWILDRLGSRTVLLWGFGLFGATVASLSCLDGSVPQLIALLLAAAVCSTLPSGIAYARVLSRTFESSRGMVLGWCLGVGGGVGSVLAPLLARALMSGFGWRAAYIGLGLAPLVIGLPTAWWLLPRDTPPTSPLARAPSASWGMGIGEILRHRQIWLLWAAALLSCCVNNGTTVHFAAIAADRGLSPTTAAFIVSSTALATMAGQFIMGAVLDRIHTPRIALPVFGCILAGTALLHLGTGRLTLQLAAILIGVGQGSEYGMFPYFITRFFGLKSFGRVYGAIYALASMSVGVGPFVMGKSFDVTGSYGPALYGLEAAMVVALVLLWNLRPYAYALDGSLLPDATARRHDPLVHAGRPAA